MRPCHAAPDFGTFYIAERRDPRGGIDDAVIDRSAPITTDLLSVQCPVGTAHGLPNAHFTNPHIIAEDNEAVVTGKWAGLAVASDFAEPADAKPLDLLREPLLLLRDCSGIIRVFHDVCRHSGMILVSEPLKIEGALRCPLCQCPNYADVGLFERAFPDQIQEAHAV